MPTTPLDPNMADTAPSDSVLTVYDEEHVITYLRLLDADAVGADWRDVARIVLHLDPKHDSDRARRAFESHFIARQVDDGARVTGVCYLVARRHKAMWTSLDVSNHDPTGMPSGP